MKYRTTAESTPFYEGRPGPMQRPKGIIYPGFELDLSPLTGDPAWLQDRNGDLMRAEYVQSISTLTLPADEDRIAAGMGWIYEDLDIRELWSYSRGAGVRIAILDTGIDLGHPCFPEGKIIARRHFYRTGVDDDVHDVIGHGTRVCGLAVASGKGYWGIAPEASLVIGKIDTVPDLNRLFKKAIFWAMEQHVDIISISKEIDPPFDGDFQSVIDEGIKRGILIIAAAGNTENIRTNFKKYPASYANVISVGAYGSSRHLYSSSPSSRTLDILAPGVNVRVAEIGGEYTTDNGTNLAAPIVAGCAAILFDYSRKKGRSNVRNLVERALIETALKIETSDVYRIGNGIIQPLNALKTL